ncbi:rRNA maturation RNase YbeY [Helicobacter sp. T3_23-1056]
MLEIYNHTKTTLPTTLESRLDFALQVALDCVFEGVLDDLDSQNNEIESMRRISRGESSGESRRISRRISRVKSRGVSLGESRRTNRGGSHNKFFHIELMFVGSVKMREFNRGFLGKDYATDVLSFPLENMQMPKISAKSSKKAKSSKIDFIDFLGAIVINLPLAKQNSKKFKHSLEIEITILFIHAALHLLGFDHERDSGEHRDKEREIMARLGFELELSQNLQSLILRANWPCK